MQLYLIRHAESENNAKPLDQRVEDPPITSIGHLQAELLANWIETLPMDTLITSPVRRALQTTRYLHLKNNQHVHVWSDVFEEGGIYRGHGPEATEGGPGLTRDEVIAHLAEDERHCTLDDRITDAGWWLCQPRETPEEAIRRASHVSQRLVDQFNHEQTVVMVIHADFKRKLMIELLGPAANTLRLGKLFNTGTTRLVLEKNRWLVESFNSVTHLPAGLITGIH